MSDRCLLSYITIFRLNERNDVQKTNKMHHANNYNGTGRPVVAPPQGEKVTTVCFKSFKICAARPKVDAGTDAPEFEALPTVLSGHV